MKYADNVLRFGPLFSWNRGPKLVSEASLFNWLMFPIIKSTHVYSLAIINQSININLPPNET